MLRHFRISIILLGLFTLLTGVIYPVVTTIVGQALFSYRANGSLIKSGGAIVGSELIGQSFTDPRYFWGRLSATVPYPYNAGSSSGSNLGPLNPQLTDLVRKRVQSLRNADFTGGTPVPVDLVTASGSGLDPHISPAAAYFQASRVARARGIGEENVRALISRYTEGRQLGILGEQRVNVLLLNLALDGVHPGGGTQ